MTASYNLELLYLHLQPNYNQFNYSTMAKITKEAALLYHSQGKPGKIEVVPTKPYSTQTDLSLAYSPGVAEPCLEIEKNPQDAYKYTAKGNLVAVISNGTAVLGLGDIGALSGKPVMEGKGLLFKIYAGIDVFDIEVNEKDPDKFIEAVKAIAPTFGGINLDGLLWLRYEAFQEVSFHPIEQGLPASPDASRRAERHALRQDPKQENHEVPERE